ncbi:MAG: SlyX family protein [Chromatiales bacterium]|jgi:SlyX protein|nr:SlyX family protein [Chromatiales bacterium]
MTSMGSDAERIDALEHELAELQIQAVYQDDTINRLNDAISAQEIRLARLQRTLELLAERLRDNSSGSSDESEPPPHY